MVCHDTARQESCHPHSNIETVVDEFAGCGGTMSNHVNVDMVWYGLGAWDQNSLMHFPSFPHDITSISIELPWITIIDFRLYHKWFTTNVMPLFTATQPGQDHKSSPDTPDTSCMSLQVALSLCLCVYPCIYVWRYVWMHLCSMCVSIRKFMHVPTYLCTFVLLHSCAAVV